MADIFDSATARRVFPLIALGGMAGAIAGPLLTRWLVRVLGVAPLLVVSATALAVAAVVVLLLTTRRRRADEAGADGAIGGSLWAGIRSLWSQPFLRCMAILMLFGDGVGTLAYALVADYAKANLSGAVARTEFYNELDLAANLLGATLQLTLTRWLLVRHGAGWGLVLPAIVNCIVLATVAWLSSRALPVAVLGIPMLGVVLATTRGFAYGMTKPAADALYTRVPREARYKGKNFIETAVWRFGDVVVISTVSALRAIGMGVVGLAALGALASAAAALVARRAGWSSDLAADVPAGGAAPRDVRRG